MIRWPRRSSRLTLAAAAPGRSIAANAAIVSAGFVVSRLLGLLREVVVAARFGTGEDYDAYVAAFRIPDLLFLVVMSGAFGSAFIPVFGGFLRRGDADRAWRLANGVLTYAVVVLVAVGLLVFVFAGPLVERVIAPELSDEGQRQATNLTRVLLLSPLLLGLGAAGKGMLEARDAFALAALAPIVYNLGIIFGAIVLAPIVGVYGLAIGVILGAAGHAAVQFAGLFRGGFRFRPTLSRRTAGLAEVARLMAPRIAGQAAFQVNFIVMTNFASRLGEGRISALNYAYQLGMLPHGVLALSVATVIFPLMSRQYAPGRVEELKQTLDRALGMLVFLTVPAAILMVAFRVSVVQVVFQFGSFGAKSTALVAEALGYFAVGLVAFAVVEAVTRAFYAMHDARTPVVVAVIGVAANIGLSWVLASRLGHGGLALAVSIANIVRMVILVVVFSRRAGGYGQELVLVLPRMVLAGAVMAVSALFVAEPLRRATDPVDGRGIGMYAAFCLAIAGTGGLYVAAAFVLRVPPCRQLVGAVRRQFGR